uniref:Neuronal acetylcholine receptor subunit alpha-6 n=1 Tax=Magallana gigas TaxID=29159 RepID=A0A8W8M8T8_MAGGI
MTGYNKDIRPGLDRGTPITINLIFFLYSINDFDLNTGKFSITAIFSLRWQDERLSWDPASYNQTDYIAIPQYRLWLPNLLNINPYDDITELRKAELAIGVKNSGECSWFALNTFDVVCDADVTKYPFDSQTCSLKFYIWGYRSNELKAMFLTPKVQFSLFSENGIWEVTDSATYIDIDVNNFETLVIKFDLKRRAPYYIVSLILPIISVSFLIGFVFLLPAESGERVGFSTTSLLSVIVYLTIIQDILPESSEPNVSTLGYILVTYVIIGSIVVIEVIISLWIQSQPSHKPIPKCILRMILCSQKKRKNNNVERFDTKQESDFYDMKDDVTWFDIGVNNENVKEFDMSTGEFSVTGVFVLNWMDERLSWNPASYNQTNTTVISQNYTGLCTWFAIETFESVCYTDVTKYPFDTQVCSIKFYVWGYSYKDIDSTFVSSKVLLTLYTENGIWEVHDSATYTQMNIYNDKEIIVELTLERRTSYYIVSLILPLAFITFLTSFVFLLPQDSGERLGFSLTVLLSVVVYLTIIQDILPEASEPHVSILGIFLSIFVVMGSLVVIVVIINLRIQNQHSQKPIPKFINRLILFVRRKDKDMVEPLGSKIELDYNEEDSVLTWSKAANDLDLIFFVVSQVVFCILGLCYFLSVLT